MNATPVYSLSFPEDTDTPDGPAQLENLALDVEAKFVTNDAAIAALPRGVLAARKSTGNGTPVTAETVQLSASFTAVAGRTYRVLASGGTLDGPAAGAANSAQLILRWAAGASVTVAGAAIGRIQMAIPASGTPNEESSIPGFEGLIVGAAAGTTTVGVTLASSNGANVVGIFSTSTSGLTITVEDVGPTVTISTAALP